MPYTAAAIANEFLELARKDGQTISPMKLMKLVYFAHGWHLALTGQPLITEPVQAWRFGPVIPSLYHEFKSFGSEPISKPATVTTWSNRRFFWGPIHIDDGPDPNENVFAKQIVRRVWEQYGRLTAVQLSNLTHLPEGPWATTPGKEERNTIIPNEAIRAYFQQLANNP